VTLKSIVVDDEAPARRRLARLLKRAGGVDVVAQLEDGDAVLRALEQESCDVLFLDVRMPGLDGVSLAQRYADLPPIVFVTAYDEYAVSAFNVNAVDYLLKPVRPERLAAALERVRARQVAARDAVSRALAAQPAAASGPPRVISSSRGLIRLFDARAITRFWASDKYTAFHADGAEQLTEEPLSALEERLAAHGFIRVHRAELVRADAIRALRLVDGSYEVGLDDGQSARVSRRVLSAIKAALMP
jgi:DNA-binding LytR/AlgR family response regulator